MPDIATAKKDIVIRVAGESGEGVISTGDLIAQGAARAGYSIFTYKTFPAEIKGGHAVYQLRLGNHEILSKGDELDILIAFNQEAYDLHSGEIRQGGLLLFDPAVVQAAGAENGIKHSPVPLRKIANEDLNFPIGKNVVSVGVIGALFGLNSEFIEKLLIEKFSRKGELTLNRNLAALAAGYKFIKENVDTHREFDVEPMPGKQDIIVVSGNQAIGMGAIAYGCRHYFGYPITPATDIMEFLATEFPKLGGAVVQAEDEMAALGMALGASYAGYPSMTATSGPGLSLMVELLGLSAMAEIPVVVIDVQRGGPSTGLPTKHEQSDLNLAIYGGHGDSPRIVLAPISVLDCFYQAVNAFNLAERYQLPVILLSDQSLAVRTETIPKPDLTKIIRLERKVWKRNGNGENSQVEKFLRYLNNMDDGVSEMSAPGTESGEHVVTGLEHSEAGNPKYDSASHSRMTEKRHRKIQHLMKHWRAVAHYGDPASDIGLLSWGSTLSQVREAVEIANAQGIRVEAMTPKMIHPFQENLVGDFIRSKKWIIIPEVNYSGQFASLIQSRFTKKVIKLNRYGGEPFKVKEILDSIKEVSKNV